eukprot:8241038-Pyramimonas_sp.AAC.1
MRFLKIEEWPFHELYSDSLITENFDAPAFVAHGLQDIMTPLMQAGLSPGRPDLRTMEMDMSMPRSPEHDWKLFRDQI